MPEVNQPPVVIPRQWNADPELRKFGNDLTMFLYQMWRRTSASGSSGSGGGGSDQIQINKNNIAALTADVDDIENGFPEYQIDRTMFQRAFVNSVQSTDYTTYTDEIIKLTKDVTVKLNATPADEEMVYVKSTGNGFYMDGNGKKIDGNSKIRFSRPYVGRWFSYSVELDTWSIL